MPCNSEYPCLILGFTGNAFMFPFFDRTWTPTLTYAGFIVLGLNPSTTWSLY